MTDRSEFVRAGCNAAGTHLHCAYPDCTCKQIPAAILAAIESGAQAQPKQGPTDADLLGAIARGWCSSENAHKEMDPDLANAIANEVRAVLRWEEQSR